MHVRSLAMALAGGGLLAGSLVLPVPATAAGGAEKTPQAHATGAAADRQGASIRVVAAEHLLGRRVVDSAGEPAGRLTYLVVRPGDGRVIYGLVGSAQMFGEFVAVPWESFRTGGRTSELRLAVEGDRMKDARRWNIDQLASLTTAPVVTEIFDHFGQVAPSGFDAQGAASDLIMGPGVITWLGEPPTAVANQILGTAVSTTGGDDIGVIDQMMIDLDHGRVAYVLLSHGGYLGSGEQWLAVPLQAFRWSGFQASVDLKPGAFQDLRGLDKSASTATRIRQSDLRELYGTFGVSQYWAS